METILVGENLQRNEALTVLQVAQLAAGADGTEQPAEHAILQAIAQRIYSHVGLKPGEVSAIGKLHDYDARMSWLRALAAGLESRSARELAFAMAFLVAVSDLELRYAEHESLEELQLVLGVDHRRATDIVVQLTETIASTRTVATRGQAPRQ